MMNEVSMGSVSLGFMKGFKLDEKQVYVYKVEC